MYVPCSRSRFLLRATTLLAPLLLHFGMYPDASSAQRNPPTDLVCGAPAVLDTYSASVSVSDTTTVGGPMECEQARQIARGLNTLNGCCEQPFAKRLRLRAAEGARGRCNQQAGSNFACNIFDNGLVCTEGCGMSVRPDSNPLGCTDEEAPSCKGQATAVPVSTSESTCVVQCGAEATGLASGSFRVKCTKCTAESNCDGLARAEAEKRARIAELEKKRDAIQAQLDALDPKTPNYGQMVLQLGRELLTITAELNKLYVFFTNLKKLLGSGERKC